MAEEYKKCFSKLLTDNQNSNFEFIIFEGFNDEFENFVQPMAIYKTENYERVNNKKTQWSKFEFSDVNGELFDVEIGDYVIKEYEQKDNGNVEIFYYVYPKEDFEENFYLEDEFIKATAIHGNKKTNTKTILNEISKEFVNTLTKEQREMLIRLLNGCKD